MFGRGLLKGLGITGRRMLSRTQCDMYPYQKRVLPKKSRIFLTMLATPDGKPKCEACMTCVNTCPDHVLKLERDAEDRKRVVEFTVDSGRCTFCGLCEEACPKGALTFTQDFERATYDKGTLTYALVTDGVATETCVTYEPPPSAEAPKATDEVEAALVKPAASETATAEGGGDAG